MFGILKRNNFLAKTERIGVCNFIFNGHFACSDLISSMFLLVFFIGKLGAFYVIFYLIIGGYTWGIMAVFMGINLAQHDQIPKYPGKAGVLSRGTLEPGKFELSVSICLFICILINKYLSGMGVRPHIGSSLADIKYTIGESTEYTSYLDEFLKRKF